MADSKNESSTIELNLLDVDSTDYESIARRINKFYRNDSAIKGPLAWAWERNQLMLDGKQWLTYNSNSQTGGMWNTLSVSKANEYIPRPVTNYIMPQYQTLKSYLLKNKPRSKVYPNDPSSHKSKTAAKIATLCLEVNWTRLKENYNYETAAANLLTYGTVFKKSYWDTSTKQMVRVPKMVYVPQTNPQTGESMGEALVQEVDPNTGDVVYQDLPLGDVNTCIVEPYRMSLDPLAMHLHEARWIREDSLQTLDSIKEIYGKEGDGFTGLADKVEEEKDLNNSMRRWFNLKTTSGVKGGTGLNSSSSQSSEDMLAGFAVVKQHFEAPSPKYPKGRLLVVAGEHCVYSGESPYQGNELGKWHPYSECRWEIVPGRFWGKGPIDDAVEIQKRINSIDSVVVLTRKTSAIPQKLIPQGSGISPGTWTGRPNQEVYYRADGLAKPEIIPPAGVDQSIFVERAQAVTDLKDGMGSSDILRGENPKGVEAANALALLYEVGTGRLFPILERWKMFVEEDQKMQLQIMQQGYKEYRPDFVRKLKAQNTELSEVEINNFIGEDLQDNNNVIVEAGSNVPKLQAAKQATIMQAAQMNMLNLQDPSNREQLQQDLGITGYDNDVGPDKRRAQYENDQLDDIATNPNNQPVVLAVDDHNIHIQVHATRMKSPTFMTLPFSVQSAYMQHIQAHQQSQAQEMQAQMLQQQAMAPQPLPGPPPPKPPQQGEGAPHGSHPMGTGKGSGGVSRTVSNAVLGSDILTPATIGTARQ